MKAKASETKNENMKIVVLGGTGLIGDPSGKTGERALNPKEVVHNGRTV